MVRRIQEHFPLRRQGAGLTSDAELLANFRSERDEASFHEIVLRHGRMVLSAARQVLGNQTEAEDVVQATFLTLFQRPSAIRRGQSLGSWLYGVSHRLALQQRRSSSRRQRREQLSDVKSLDETTRMVASAELQSEIGRALQAIPEPYRQAIIYCYLEERSLEAAAKLLGCPVGTLWSRLARGREKLRTILAKRGWSLELPVIALVLSAAEGSSQAAGQVWLQLKELIHWQPHAAIVNPMKPALAGLLLKEKIMFSLRSVISSMVVAGLMLCGLGVGFKVLAGTPDEPPLQGQKATVDIKPRQYPADWKGRLRGTITAADTGKPLAGATIAVHLAGVAAEYQLLDTTSGDDGKYHLPLPVGHAWLSGLYAPPGYYSRDERTYSQAVSREGEDAVFDFKLYRGMAWNIQFAGGPAKASKPPKFIATVDAPPGTLLPRGSSFLVIGDLQGKAVLTLPRASERYRIGSFWPECGLSQGAGAFLEIDGEFDPEHIVGQPETSPDGKGQRIKDRAGRIATVEEAEFVVLGQSVTIRMTRKPESTEPNLVFQGKVMDEQDKPIEGAEAVLSFHSATGGASSDFKAKTNEKGQFQLSGPNRSDIRAQKSKYVNIQVWKKGYGGLTSDKLELQTVRKTGNGDFGTVTIKRGVTLRGRVFDETGKPVQGAVIMNLTDYFLYSHLQCRTDAEGRFEMSGLAEGKHSLEAQYGRKSAHINHQLSANSEEVRIEVRPQRGSGLKQELPEEEKSKEPEVKKQAWNLTPPVKVPKYQHLPKYALLAFGPNQETRVWLVLDGETLYVDCHGNGDLTAPECRIVAKQGEVKLGNPGFYKDIVSYQIDLTHLKGTADSQLRLDLLRRDAQFVPKTPIDQQNQKQWIENQWERGIMNRTSKHGKSAGTGLHFVTLPENTQVIQFDGPLSLAMKYGDKQIFERGSGGSDFPLHVGCIGRVCKNGTGLSMSNLALGEVPEDLHLIATVEFPGKSLDAKPITKVFQLKERCCGDTFHGTVIVPQDAGPGKAIVTVIASSWPGHEVMQGKFEVPIKD